MSRVLIKELMGIRSGVLLVLLALTIGCGTAHHFTPARPLADGEWQISTYLHFDLGQYPIRYGVGELSAWYGTGRDLNLGFGMNSPLGISHLSWSKYWETGNHDHLSIAGHFNQITGLNTNPYLELLLGYSLDDGEVRQSLSAGLAYGHGSNVVGGLLGLTPASDRRVGGDENRFMPVYKFQISNNDLALSLINYRGRQNATKSALLRAVREANDTLVYLRSDQIDSIKSVSDTNSWIGYTDALGLFLSDGDTLVIHSGYVRGDYGSGALLFLVIGGVNFIWNDFEWIMDAYGYNGEFISHGLGSPSVNESQPVFVDRQELISQYEQNGTILVTQLPMSLERKLNELEVRYRDVSVGLSIQSDDWNHHRNLINFK